MSWKRVFYAMAGLMVALGVCATQLRAQDQQQTMTTGGITGIVVDPNNAVVNHARVGLKNNSNGRTDQTTTNSSGNYEFILLDPGSYTLTAEAKGFEIATQTVTVPAGEPILVNFKLKVLVKGEAQPLIPGEKAAVIRAENGNSTLKLTPEQIASLPSPGKDMTFLAQIAPGAVMNTEGGTGHEVIFGMPANSNLFTVDGMVNNEPFLNANNAGATTLLLGSDEIEDMTVVSNGYAGEHGDFAGSNIHYTTRTGEDGFHGDANYYWNGRQLNANTWLNNQAGNPRPFDNVNQWSASIGGAVKQKKLFVFASTEGLRVRIPTSQQVSIPSPQFEGSVMQNLENNLPNSAPFYCQNLTVTPPNGIPLFCPSSAFATTNPSTMHLGQGIFNLYNGAPGAATATDILPANSFPDPNNAGNTIYTGDGCGSFTGDPNFGVSQASTLPPPGNLLPCALSFLSSEDNAASQTDIAARADYILGGKDKAFVRFQRSSGTLTAHTDPINSVFDAKLKLPEDQGQIEETHTFNPAEVNQARIGVQVISALTTIGSTSATATFPVQLHFSDNSFADLGGSLAAYPRGRASTQFELSDDFSKISGTNTFRFGGDFRRVDISNHDFGANTTPFVQIFSLNDFFNGGSTGDSLVQSFPLNLEQPMAYYTASGYLEDDWQESDTLTITMSLRLAHDSDLVCRYLCFSRLTTGFKEIANGSNGQAIGEVPYNLAIANNKLQAYAGFPRILADPRLGFAWRPLGSSNNTVLRGGVGLFHGLLPTVIGDALASNPPQTNSYTILNNNVAPTEFTNLFESASLANEAFLGGFAQGMTVSEIATQNPTFVQPGITLTDTNMKAPLYEKASLQAEHEFKGNTTVWAGVNVMHGVHLPIINNSANAYGVFDLPLGTVPPAGETYPTGQISTFPSGQCSGTSTPCTGSDPRFAQVTVISSSGVSTYYGATARVEHRFTKFGGGMVQVNYTYSKAYDDVSNGGLLPFNSGETPSLMSPEDPTAFRSTYGPSDYDVRHAVNANYVWDIPFSKFTGGKGPARLLDGWQIAGTVFFHTGFPYSVTDGALSSTLAQFNYFSTVLPEPLTAVPLGQACGKAAAGTKGVPCLPIASFPTPGTEAAFGTGLRNIFRGPKYFNTDMSLMKSTRFPGWSSAQIAIGVEAFNLFNHANFDLPVSNIASPLFGTIQRQVSEPTSILGLFPGSDASGRILQVKAQIRW